MEDISPARFKTGTYKKYEFTSRKGKAYVGLQGYEKFFIMTEEYKDEEIRHGDEVPPVQYMVNSNLECYLPVSDLGRMHE
jgi:hypothetical protein